MDYQVVVPSELGVTPEELIDEWNSDPRCREAAEARAEPDPPKLDEASAIVAVLGTVVLGLGTSALYELLKAAVERLLERKKVKRRLEVTSVETESSSLLVIKVEEES